MEVGSMIDQAIMEKYAELALRTGVNLQKGQPLMVNGPVDGADFVRIVARKAYEMGAKIVHMNWSDDELTLLKYQNSREQVITTVPEWLLKLYHDYAEDDSAVFSIMSSNPDLLKDVDPERIPKATKAHAEALKNFRQYTSNDKITWSIIAIPNSD